MILGARILRQLFQNTVWAAYRDGEPYMPEPGPNSVDVTLGCVFLQPIVDGDHIDPLVDKNHYNKMILDSTQHLVLHPGRFVLGCVRERFDTSNPVASDATLGDRYFTQILDGRSTMGRLGVGIHVTAGYGDYGFRGAFTLEIFNLNPRAVLLYPGMRIGQITFMEVEQPDSYEGQPGHVYDGVDHFNEPVGPRLGRERFLPMG